MHSFLRVVSCSLLPPFHHPQKRACVLVVDGGGLFFITITPLRGLYCPPLIPTRIWWQSLLAQRQAKIGNSIPADSRWNAHQNWHSTGMPTGMLERNGNQILPERNQVSFFFSFLLIITFFPNRWHITLPKLPHHHHTLVSHHLHYLLQLGHSMDIPTTYNAFDLVFLL